MLSLLKKEINSFFSNITAYLFITIYLVLNGLFLFVFPGNFNILQSGYAGLESMFAIAPWVFMFLIPAITMRMFSDELRLGTLELLLTRPLTEWNILFAKYLAAFILVLISILPTLIYYYSVVQLGDPIGNIDHAGTWGSYIGLLFLSAAYIGIGLLASSLSDNPIVSFLLAVFFCFFLFAGFDQIASLNVLGNSGLILMQIGINEHYISMSRGVIDSRDVVYFLGLIAVLLMSTRLKLQSRKW